MNGSIAASRARWTLATVFTVFLLINVVVLTLAFLAQLRNDPSKLPPHLGEEVSVGVRLLVIAIGAVFSWFLARMLFKHLVVQDVSPGDSVGPAYSLLSYLLLVLAAYSFLGFGTWLWLPGLFLIVLVWSLISLWSLVGWLPMIVALVLAALTAFFSWVIMT